MDFPRRWQETSRETAQSLHLLAHELDVLRARLAAAPTGWLGWQAPSRQQWVRRSIQASTSLHDATESLRHIERQLRSRDALP